jgi:hypothetical protein
MIQFGLGKVDRLGFLGETEIAGGHSQEAMWYLFQG